MHHKTGLACMALLLSYGCAPPVNTDNVDSAMKDDLLQDATITAEVNSGKAYLIGTLDGTLASALTASIRFTPYDGSATDGPIFLSQSTLNGLSDTQKSGMVAAFQARAPIVLVNAGADAVNNLLEILGQPFDFVLPAGAGYVELFAVDTEAGGDVYHWTMYPPTDTSEDPDGSGDQQTRANLLVDWLKANGQRTDVDETARRAATADLQSAAAAGGQELTQLASAFVKQDNFTKWGNNYQISHYVYGCHSITTGDDWIYVQQRCLFYAGGAYKGNIQWYKGGAGACAFWYLDNITLDTVLKGYDYDPASVGLQQASPETANNVTQLTSGVSWNIGGEVSVGKDGPAAKISGGVTISNTTTVNVQDCEIVNQSASRNNNAAWSFQFKRSGTVAYIGYADVTNPPRLATTTFQPFNQWIWRVSPSARAANPPMHIKFNVSLVGTTGMWDFMWVAHPAHTPLDGGSWEYDVPFAYPPIAP